LTISFANPPEVWATEEIGNNGTFNQSGGTNAMDWDLHLSGNYNLSQSGVLSVGAAEIISGTFTQTGGTNTGMNEGLLLSPSGTYILSGGILNAGWEVFSYLGGGTFTQTGGTNTTGSLTIDATPGYTGSYDLSGSGILSASFEGIGDLGKFTQSGGKNTTKTLSIGTNGTYLFQGGTLNINSSFGNNGKLDLDSGTGTINANTSILRFTGGALSNSQNATFNIDSHSLVIIPSGTTSTFTNAFAHFNNAGIIHELGSPLYIEPSRSISGSGTITDHVNCGGTLTATSGGHIDLSGGLMTDISSIVDLGLGGYLYVNDASSGMNGGRSIVNV
jgi:hypothetical protein